MKKRNLLGLDEADLISLCVDLGEKPFRGRQLYHQIYVRKAGHIDEMTDLSKAFREKLKGQWTLELPAVQTESLAQDGTLKLLFGLNDGRFIEAVYIPEEGRDTLCISSQVGCGVGCTFCMTAQMGFVRNLKPDEILGQVFVFIRRGILRTNGFNIVFMGMGEPLYNYQHVMKAFRLMVDQSGMALSQRKITVSTSGVVPVLRKMHDEPVVPNLAISLNATTDDVRDRVMPINRKWNLQELIDTCRKFPLEPRRRITFEYVLLAGETDSDEDARRLARLLRGIRAKINLIPYNPNPGLPHKRPSDQRVEAFRGILAAEDLSVFVRRTRGSEVAAACGQLAFLEEARQSA